MGPVAVSPLAVDFIVVCCLCHSAQQQQKIYDRQRERERNSLFIFLLLLLLLVFALFPRFSHFYNFSTIFSAYFCKLRELVATLTATSGSKARFACILVFFFRFLSFSFCVRQRSAFLSALEQKATHCNKSNAHTRTGHPCSPLLPPTPLPQRRFVRFVVAPSLGIAYL